MEQRRVLEEVVDLTSLDHEVAVWGLPEPVPAGTRIVPASDDPDLHLPSTRASWFFLVDDEPSALLGHPLRYVTIAVDTGDLEVTSTLSWPRFEGVAPFAQLVRFYSTSPLAEPEEELPIPEDLLPEGGAGPIGLGPCASGRAPRRYGLTFSGGDARDGFHRGMQNTAVSVMQLMRQSGFTQVRGAWANRDSSGEARRKFFDTLRDFAGEVECCDEVFVYIISHGINTVRRVDDSGQPWDVPILNGRLYPPGGFQGTPGAFQAGEPTRWGLLPAGNSQFTGEKIMGDELAAALGRLRACHVTVFIESCFSGTAVQHLQSVPGVERLYTSCGADEVSEAAEGGRGPATQGLVDNFVDGPELGPAIAQAVADASDPANPKRNPFSSGGVPSRAGVRTDRPTTYDRSGGCVCCGDHVKSESEACDATADPPDDQCPPPGVCVSCGCVCRTSYERIIDLQPPEPAICSYAPVQGELVIEDAGPGVSALSATLGGALPADYYGTFLSFGTTDGNVLYVGVTGEQGGSDSFYAELYDASGTRLLQSFPVTGMAAEAGAGGSSWELWASVDTAVLQTVDPSTLVVLATQDDCHGEAEVPEPIGPCPWARE